MSIAQYAAVVVVLVGFNLYLAAGWWRAQDENSRLLWELGCAERGRDAARLIVQDIAGRTPLLAAVAHGYDDGAEFSRRVAARRSDGARLDRIAAVRAERFGDTA